MFNQDDLRYPSIWAEREPYLERGLLFVPDYYHRHEEFAMPPWKEIFQEDRPLAVEYCSGNGEWIVSRAKAHPEINWIAVEWDFGRAKQIFARRREAGLTNLLIVFGEGLTFSRHYLKESELSYLYVNFPDPWPKERHAKHRLIQTPFAEEAARTLIDGGQAIFATDHALYAQQMIDTFRQNLAFKPLFPSPYFSNECQNYGSSFFESLWRKKGLNIHYIKFEKHVTT